MNSVPLLPLLAVDKDTDSGRGLAKDSHFSTRPLSVRLLRKIVVTPKEAINLWVYLVLVQTLGIGTSLGSAKEYASLDKILPH
jgi:hypothetical protein